MFTGMSGDNTGVTVSGVGDVDGDGLDDIGIGARYNADGAGNGGKGYIVLASSLNPINPILDLNNADYHLVGDSGNSKIGRILGGDIDGDGLSDIVLGGVSIDHGWSASPSAYVVLSSSLDPATPTVMLSNSDYIFTGTHSDGIRGGLAMGDADGDGLQDIVFGQRTHALYGENVVGRANLFRGSSLPSLTSPISLVDADNVFTGVTGDYGYYWGYSVALSDFDGDGQSDVFMGSNVNTYTAFSPCEN